MSRNLSADHCVECGYGPVMLHDLAGKPLELRTVGKYVPTLGTRWDCPRCQTAYFAAYNTRGDCADCSTAIPRGLGEHKETSWNIDLSYWASYNDEPVYDDMQGLGEPRGLVLSGREEQRTSLELHQKKEVWNGGAPKCNCGQECTLADIAGKELELRSLVGEVPRAGVRFDCDCGKAYFIHYRTRGMCVMCAIQGRREPDFAGTWEFDFFWWSTYGVMSPNDDSAGAGTPHGLVSEGHEDQRFSLTRAADVEHLAPKQEIGPRSRSSALAERL